MSIGSNARKKKKKTGKRDEGKSVAVKKVAARSSRNVASVRTQSSPSIGATALTAWAPRNPINKYYNGTPREVGAQYILLSPPPPTPPSLYRAPSSPAVIFLLLLVASRRKKDLSYVALSQSLHSSYTRSPRPRPRPRNFVSHPVVRHPPNHPTNPPRTVAGSANPCAVPAHPRNSLALSIRLFLILPKPATSHHPPLDGPSSPPPFTFYFSSSELKPRSCAARGRA